ncbi:MAG TPA: FCD domain-containing protein [Trebonia sp.]|nr:FCD domain-containing protein [Trebonia sp.]
MSAGTASRRTVMRATLRAPESQAPARQIFDETAIAIVEGRLRPGQTLHSHELARDFLAGRAAASEALTELERRGAVVLTPPGRPPVAQASVTRATRAQLKDIYELRASLFTLVAELIVDRCPDERLAELWAWQAALEEAAARGAVDDYFWRHAGFRLVEGALTGNEELQRIISELAIRAMQVTHLSFSLPGRLARSVADHRRLLQAYGERDRDTAVVVSRLMIMTGYRALQESGLITSPAA